MKNNIRFISNYVNNSEITVSNLIDMKSYELLDVCASFSICINDKEFFHEPDFPILEFLKEVALWAGKEGSMYYNSIETDDNPLVSFIKNENGYTISSPWQKFECNDCFSKEELLSTLNMIENKFDM